MGLGFQLESRSRNPIHWLSIKEDPSQNLPCFEKIQSNGCHDHMCVSYSVYCAMVVSSAYLRFPSLGLEEDGSFGTTHPHVVSGDIV